MLADRFGISQRRACRLVGQHRSTQRHQPTEPERDQALRRGVALGARLWVWIAHASEDLELVFAVLAAVLIRRHAAILAALRNDLVGSCCWDARHAWNEVRQVHGKACAATVRRMSSSAASSSSSTVA